ncbi:MAG: glycosyltransferase family 1 protein [Planctomycetota bacterium]|nr:MAG: glycosyltransferase family 1 protein [Planctomycetota bacterium]
MSRRIVFDATALALQGYTKGGAYRYGMELLRRLPGALPADWKLDLYFNFFRKEHVPRMHETMEKTGVRAHRCSRVHPRLLRAVHAPAEWTAGACDLFHGPFDRVPRTRKAARVVTIHDLAFLRAPEGLPAQWIRELRATVPASARRAHRVLTVSEFSRRDIVERLQIPAERVEAIYHGIPELYAPPQDPQADLLRLRARYGIEPGFVLYLGTLQPNKNIEVLCAAWQILRRRGFPGQLVLAGARGWLYDEMWARIHARGDDAGVLQTGYLEDQDIRRLYGCCSAFVLVSLLEGFGIPVIEAMACGAPVVAADACSLPEVAGGAALIVDPGDAEAIARAIEIAATAGPERDALIARGLARSRHFDWDTSARQHVGAYRRALEAARAA